MSLQCAACESPIQTAENTADLGVKKILADESHLYTDGLVTYCSEACAPEELSGKSYDKPPLQALVEFFHQSNTEMSIEYWTEDRGWEKDTVDSLLLGWAPTDTYAAYNYLKDQGYSNADILATGAFYPDTPPFPCIWTGRFIFPYYDSEGIASYMISRRVPPEGHSEDTQSDRKYSKLTKTKPYAIHDEPIYGIESVSEGCDVVVAEGIADAISAIEKGYHVLSPVTNSFKNKHYSEVSEILRKNNVETVYIVPDSEEVQESQKESGLDISVGLYGGLKNAIEIENRVEETDISVRIAQLPRPNNVEKVDLDDYLQSNNKSDFDTVLANSKEPSSFEEYDTIKERIKTMDKARNRDKSKNRNIDGDSSELFEITLLDVLPDDFDPHTRNPNPIQHTGNSENYFAITVMGEDTVAYDFKRDVAYNALTYILCKIGERPVEAPNGSLSDREVWLAWKWCKENDIFINESDPIPSSAINHIARELGYDVGGDMLPYRIYAESVQYVQEHYGIDPGRTIKSTADISSSFYTIPIEEVLEGLYDTTDTSNIPDLPDGFNYEGNSWKSTIVTNPQNSLSLIAVMKGYLSESDLQDVTNTKQWIDKLTTQDILELCLFVKTEFNINKSKKPPYEALEALAERLTIEFDQVLSTSQEDELQEIFYNSTYNEHRDDPVIINS